VIHRSALRQIGAILAALAAGVLATCGTTACHRSPRYNVIVVVVDALRADHLGCYGAKRGKTPRIDRLARNALVFANAYSNATFTFPSTASMFTSTLPVVHRIAWDEQRQEQIRRMSDEYLLLTEVFHEQGYRTGLMTFPGWVTPTANYMQGVDVRIESKRNDRDLLDHARRFITESAPDKPFFLYLHFIDLHDYFHPRHLFKGVDEEDPEISDALLALRGATPREAFTSLVHDLPTRMTDRDLEFLANSYDRMVRRTDRVIGDLADHLQQQGLLNTTLVAITADHGEQFLEHGALIHGGDDFYNEVLRIPFVISNPALFPSTRRATTPISAIDLGPTLLDLAGLDVPEVFQGESLAEGGTADRVVFACNDWTWKAISREWSYIAAPSKDREELYRLSDDPGETVNLVSDEPDAARTMRRHVERMRDACADHAYLSIQIDEVELPDEQRDRLRALGYLDDSQPSTRPTSP
jgi:arylsulfatase A-like enzyme